MFSSRSTFQRFTDVISCPSKEIRVAEAALVIASEFRHDLSVEEYMAWIDRAAAAVPEGGGLEEIAQFFACDLGFDGDTSDYYNPRNSLLDQVIERKRGIPITLSILLMELAAAKGWQLRGVAFPAHFMVLDTVSKKYIDPFNRSQVLNEEAARNRVLSMLGRKDWKQSWGKTSTPRQTIFRLLTNLKVVFLDRKEYDRAAAVQEKLLVLAPNRPQEYRDLGIVAANAGNWQMAQRFLTEYLEMRPGAADSDLVRAQLQHLSDEIARRN